MGRSAKDPSRTKLLTQLGEEAFALFRSGALPVPVRLRETVAAIEAVPERAPQRSPKGTARARVK